MVLRSAVKGAQHVSGLAGMAVPPRLQRRGLLYHVQMGKLRSRVSPATNTW